MEKQNYRPVTKADYYMADAIRKIWKEGFWDINPRPKYKDGKPAHTLSINHVVRTYDLSKGEYPLCTLRPIAWKTGIREVLVIYQKATNVISEMEKMGVNWWKDWDIGDGTIGQRYGATVARYNPVKRVLDSIIEDPYGRRKVISLWQEQDLKETPGLAPCAYETIWNVRNDGNGKEYLDMLLIQRSGDMLTASGPGGINEFQYACFLLLFARHCSLEPGVFTHVVANEQMYDRHLGIDGADEILSRAGNITIADYQRLENGPRVILNPDKKDFYEMTADDFTVVNYDPCLPQINLELGI